MHKHNTCVFSTSNNSDYAENCILRLEQARRNMGFCEAYLIGSTFNHSIKMLAKTRGVNLIEAGNKNGYFEKEWVYPKECYYWALAPLFLKSKYAIYIDGDVFCMRNPYLNLSEYSLESISGITLDLVPGITQKELDIYTKEFTFNNSERINSGVLYMNLGYLREKEFTKNISALYKWSIEKKIPRKGDDSLLWVFIKTHDYPWGYLPNKYNWIRSRFGDPPQDVVWFHNNKS